MFVPELSEFTLSLHMAFPLTCSLADLNHVSKGALSIVGSTRSFFSTNPTAPSWLISDFSPQHRCSLSAYPSTLTLTSGAPIFSSPCQSSSACLAPRPDGKTPTE